MFKMNIQETASDISIKKVKKKKGRPSKAVVEEREQELKEIEEFEQREISEKVSDNEMKDMRFNLRKQCLLNPGIFTFKEDSVQGFSDEKVQQEHELMNIRLSNSLNKQIVASGLGTLCHLTSAISGLEDLPSIVEKDESLQLASNSYLSLNLLNSLGDIFKIILLFSSDILTAYKIKSERNALLQKEMDEKVKVQVENVDG
jgi:hypothetical protein